MWSSNDSDGASITRSTDGEVRVYKDNGATQSVAGITDTEDFDSLIGVHVCTIDLNSDAFYAIGANYTVVLQGATIATRSVNAVLAHFSIQNRVVASVSGSVGSVVGHTVQTGDSFARLGAAGVGLTDLGGMSDGMKAEVNAEDDTAITDAALATAAAVADVPTLTEFNARTIIAANYALEASVQAIQNNTRTHVSLAGWMERPDSGNTRFRIYLNNYDTVGNMEVPDSAPTVAVANEAGTDRSGNLQHPTTHVPQTTMVLVSDGRYWIEYELDSADTSPEQLNFTFSIIEGGVTRQIDRAVQVADTTGDVFTAADRTKLDTLHDTRLTAARAALLDEITAARLAQLDAGNLPADVDGIKAKTDSLTFNGNDLHVDVKKWIAETARVGGGIIKYPSVNVVMADGDDSTAGGNIAAIIDKLQTAMAEGTAVPGKDAPLLDKLEFLLQALRNDNKTTPNSRNVVNDAGTEIGTATVSKVAGTSFNQGKMT